MTEIKMGQGVRDRVTGFAGIVVGRTEYLTGCNQLCVQPSAKKEDGSYIEGRWFDETRLELVNATPIVIPGAQHDNAPDIPAPIK